MIPLRPASLFRSRWKALLWSAGIVWMAVDVAQGNAPQSAEPDNGATVGAEATNSDAAANLIAAALN